MFLTSKPIGVTARPARRTLGQYSPRCGSRKNSLVHSCWISIPFCLLCFSEGLAVVLDLGDGRDHGMVGRLGLMEHMNPQRTVAAAEINSLPEGDAQVEEYLQMMVMMDK